MMKRLVTTLALSALFASSATLAEGGYVGASVGQSNYEEDLDDFGLGEFDESDTGWKVFGGYRFNRYFAVEGFYVDLGEPDGDISGIDASVEIDGFGGYAVGILPVSDRFDLFGKVGVLAWDADVEVGTVSNDDDGSDLAWGAGAAFAFTDNLAIRAEAEFFDFDEGDAYLASVGAEYRF